ncbi:hypothetical protein AAFN46_19235 [Pseudomonas sp. CAU 1711]|uniref:hypothetical protein n=1 Tax=Pseudomonas sp. CAU 1711 TaxID=3140356 RepID=UPI003260AF6C
MLHDVWIVRWGVFFYCVEPEHESISQDYYDWKFTVRRGFGHHLIFPHVDSCLGVICQLPGNTVFAGHINGFYQSDYSPQSHRNAFQSLIQQLNGAVVQRAAIFGNVGDGNMEMGWADYINFPWANRVEFLSLSCAQGVDVMFDVDSGRLQIMRYMAGRNYRQRPQQQVVANTNLYTIAGYTLVNC